MSLKRKFKRKGGQRSRKKQFMRLFNSSLTGGIMKQPQPVRIFWLEFQNTMHITPEGTTTILDKLPLNILHLALIEKIFPDAKVIVALRDPRDVCLSNYMQFFLLNNSISFFRNFHFKKGWCWSIKDIHRFTLFFSA